MGLKDALRTVASELDRVGSRWALVGGLAVSARLEPRFTRDIDLAVFVSDDREAEQLVKQFLACGFSVYMLLEQETADRLPEVVDEADSVEVARGLIVPVAQLGHLLAMKILARDDERRPQDLVDIRSILKNATREELERARHALGLIMDRGCHRGKNLLKELEGLASHESK